MNFKNFIFPQLTPNKKQKKELPYIYCYNIRIVDYRQVDDNEFKNYFNYMIKFAKNNIDMNLVGAEHGDENLKIKMRQALSRPGMGNSAEIDIRFIKPNEKKQMDEYLIMTGWKKNLDKYAYIFEGCVNDEKVFIGGKKEFVLHYCKLFPKNPNCEILRKKFEVNQTEKKMGKIFNNPDVADKIMDNFVKLFEEEENS